MKHFISVIALCVTGMYAAYGQPVFRGGQDALKRFISEKIVYPEFSRQNCISGTVQVRFALDATGKVTYAKIHQGLGIDLDDEALRVVKLTSGKWDVPANYNTATQIILPVSFTADPSRCSGVHNQDSEKAIQAYKNRQGLENVVVQYYKSKQAGIADTSGENVIINLKKQLGFDDELVTEMLNRADNKLKQDDRQGACEDWLFIRNIGSNRADKFIERHCK